MRDGKENAIVRRDKALKRLLELAPKMLIGSVSETYRTCGTPGCRCHTTGPKHGPHWYVSYLGEHGRTTGYYVRKAWHDTVEQGLAAWKDFQALAKEVAHLNETVMRADKPKRKTRKKKRATTR